MSDYIHDLKAWPNFRWDQQCATELIVRHFPAAEAPNALVVPKIQIWV